MTSPPEGEAPAQRDLPRPSRGRSPRGGPGCDPARREPRPPGWRREDRPGSGCRVGRASGRMVGVAWLPVVGLLTDGPVGLSGTADRARPPGQGSRDCCGRLAADPAGSASRPLGPARRRLRAGGRAAGPHSPSLRGGPDARGRSRWLASSRASVPPVVWGVGLLAVSRVSHLCRRRPGPEPGRRRSRGRWRRVSRVRPRPIARVRTPRGRLPRHAVATIRSAWTPPGEP